jgi:hypothetical protein
MPFSYGVFLSSRQWWLKPATFIFVQHLQSSSGAIGVSVYGRGEIPARQWTYLTTAAPAGIVSLLEA